MKKIRILFVALIICKSITAQENGYVLKKNFVYLNPFFFSNDVLELNDYWISVGYDRKTNDKVILGLNCSSIFLSKPSSPVLFGPSLNASKSKGFRLNAEFKYIFYKRFYGSLNIAYQGVETTCREEVLEYSPGPSVKMNDYFVFRETYSFIPKIGWLLKKQRSDLYVDLNLGAGIKYIRSETSKKIGDLSTAKESYSGKPFEYGQSYTYHPLFHVKIGYNF